jgi:hypothetical protein
LNRIQGFRLALKFIAQTRRTIGGVVAPSEIEGKQHPGIQATDRAVQLVAQLAAATKKGADVSHVTAVAAILRGRNFDLLCTKNKPVTDTDEKNLDEMEGILLRYCQSTNPNDGNSPGELLQRILNSWRNIPGGEFKAPVSSF